MGLNEPNNNPIFLFDDAIAKQSLEDNQFPFTKAVNFQYLNRNFPFDMRMWIIIKQFKILKLKTENIFNFRIDFHGR